MVAQKSRGGSSTGGGAPAHMAMGGLSVRACAPCWTAAAIIVFAWLFPLCVPSMGSSESKSATLLIQCFACIFKQLFVCCLDCATLGKK